MHVITRRSEMKGVVLVLLFLSLDSTLASQQIASQVGQSNVDQRAGNNEDCLFRLIDNSITLARPFVASAWDKDALYQPLTFRKDSWDGCDVIKDITLSLVPRMQAMAERMSNDPALRALRDKVVQSTPSLLPLLREFVLPGLGITPYSSGGQRERAVGKEAVSLLELSTSTRTGGISIVNSFFLTEESATSPESCLVNGASVCIVLLFSLLVTLGLTSPAAKRRRKDYRELRKYEFNRCKAEGKKWCDILGPQMAKLHLVQNNYGWGRLVRTVGMIFSGLAALNLFFTTCVCGATYF